MAYLLNNHYKDNIEEENEEYIKWYFPLKIPNDFMIPFKTSKGFEMERVYDEVFGDTVTHGFLIWWYKNCTLNQCEKCELLETIFPPNNDFTPYEYWLLTELFVYLHDGKDYCDVPTN